MPSETRDHHGRVRDTSVYGLTLEGFSHWRNVHKVLNIKSL